MKRNIAIIAGGYSSEIVVSLKSAEGIFSFMDHDKYNVYILLITENEWLVKLNSDETVAVNKNDFSFSVNGERIRFDFAYITIHGPPGENGLLQGYLEMLHFPYTSFNAFASELTCNKFACIQYLIGFC